MFWGCYDPLRRLCACKTDNINGIINHHHHSFNKGFNMYTKLNIQWDFDLEDPNDKEAHDRFAEANGVPTTINVYDYFEDPGDITNDQLTDALSDEHGWLILGMQSTKDSPHTADEACKTDNTNGIINHQQQPLTPQEDNMENINSTTPNSNEVSMSQQEMIVQMFQSFLTDGGSPKVTEFKKHLNNLINSDIKQLCTRSGKSADGNDWRSVLKAQFSGRGAKWVQVPTDNVIPTLDRFDTEGFKTESYRTHIENAGYAFIRFAGPRIDNNIQSAAFEVRTNGSTLDHPKQLHYIAVNQLESLVKPLGGTPHSLKLEAIAKPEVATETPIDLGAMCDEIVNEMTEAVSDETVAAEDFDMSQLDDLELDLDDDNVFESFDELYEDEEGFNEII